MSRFILIVQSRSTGRLLLSRKDEVWHFTSSNPKNPEIAELFLALNECHKLTGISYYEDTGNAWSLEFLSTHPHTLFHVWIDDEPIAADSAAWFYLFDFPEDLHESVYEVLKKDEVIRKTYSLEA